MHSTRDPTIKCTSSNSIEFTSQPANQITKRAEEDPERSKEKCNVPPAHQRSSPNRSPEEDHESSAD